MTSIIEVENLSKKYILGNRQNEPYATLRDKIAYQAMHFGKQIVSHAYRRQVQSTKNEIFWALDQVTFNVHEGERIGVIGSNGAGKSTLLKLLSRITEPSAGRIRVKGRVASLLEVGTGFHPELSGRENIYLNGAVLGMSKVEIKNKFNEIVEFAEVSKFLDTPVKRYSSGMYVRLAFAVAAHLEPEILLVDEVLAVGDASFQRKCLGKMKTVSESGRTIIFVSHNLQAISALCQRAIYLEHGQLRAIGPTQEIINQYLETVKRKVSQGNAHIVLPKKQNQSAHITEFSVENNSGKSTLRFDITESILIRFNFHLDIAYQTLLIVLHVWDKDNNLVLASLDSDWSNYHNQTMHDNFPREKGDYQGLVTIPAPMLNQGIYELEFILTLGPSRIDTIRGIYIEIDDNGSFLSYVTKSSRGGLLATPLKWQIDEKD
ncbi:MAG TPA: polysaccharide ABC transporter ATP-binding protein [Gammaproteobacteria bacterium]|nr:polysaccharide ABC transporter ATP-binding protein [Gammaproteobacteria bacterium]